MVVFTTWRFTEASQLTKDRFPQASKGAQDLWMFWTGGALALVENQFGGVERLT